MKYKMCKRCVMDNKGDKNIKFDKDGNCEYCNQAMKEKPVYNKEDFDNLIKMLKEKGKNQKYDCVLGISGGIDSSYLAYILTQNGIRVKGVHIDAGWNTPISEENVKILCEKCWIGMNSMILPGVELGNRTIVGAGSIVTKSFKEGNCIIAGNPAKVIRNLNEEEI